MLLANSAEVVAVDIKREGLVGLASSGATVIAADLTQAADRDRVVSACGTCDGLVNCAGVIRSSRRTRHGRRLGRGGGCEHQGVFSVAGGCRSAAPRRCHREHASVSAIKAATPEAMVYAASKAAVCLLPGAWRWCLPPRG